ncbi:MAG TPA: hypothetical protein VES20_18160 [Bryobacteraceae bacterium]|nr:hypothetical protein [Bryobacteraceae bacterium]
MNIGDIGKILDQYADRSDPNGTDDDFDQVAPHAPATAMSQGVAEAFRSDQTPPFPNMLGQMFGRADSGTRASILNQLIAAAGPAILSGALSRGGGAGMGGLGGMLGGLLGGGSGFGQGSVPQVTPEQASSVPPEAVEELAREAQQKDPTVVDRVSDFAAQNPMLVKGLGAIAVGIALKHLAGQKRGGFF